uniref:Uncharacterized protein n=1 Tax=Glossina brevipalpis TaxID=37001 RepID=A0A1A9X422_9MUSC
MYHQVIDHQTRRSVPNRNCDPFDNNLLSVDEVEIFSMTATALISSIQLLISSQNLAGGFCAISCDNHKQNNICHISYSCRASIRGWSISEINPTIQLAEVPTVEYVRTVKKIFILNTAMGGVLHFHSSAFVMACTRNMMNCAHLW